ncbi:hypothetical protein CCHL11_05146 [Colletotrichum chlorophyti]|uniref:MACPF domain-containing protein n=1 Tax=Colletotrichum chlorophyti TaxID=708187 RepID=A0A1Q8S260_9PEZI|nr:hypothetical protein CCHL11_05146 [Colletotrichum chlorophyti]
MPPLLALSVPSKLDELQWSLIIQNCNVMHGWFLDENTNQIKMAARPAFTLRKNLNIYETEENPRTTVGEKVLTMTVDETESTRSMVKTKPSTTTATAGIHGPWKKPNAIPNYRVTDGTKIDIITVEDETRHSMVLNNFAKSSTEKTPCGGYGGFGVAASGGISSESQQSKVDEGKQFSSKMIGKYMACPPSSDSSAIPRVTLTLNPEDLEATPELVAHIEKIRNGKNDMDLRDLYRRFGEFFAQEVTLGGVLLSTRVMQATETTAQAKTKEAFKTAIGLSISTRSDLRRLVETVARCSTKALVDAHEWFSATAPDNLTELINIPRSMELLAQIRFKAKNERNKVQYLVHQVHEQIKIKIKDLAPSSFQGPRVISYDPKWESRDGVWIITPRNKDLRDGSKITIRASHELNTKRFLAVIRTSANFFVPCISSSGHQHIWTIRKAPKANKPLPDEPTQNPLKDTDAFCLTFDFANNSRGYRDFVDDDRGYRRRDYPSATNNRLLLAQPIDTGGMFDRHTMLMADEVSTVDGICREIRVNGNSIGVDMAVFTLDLLGEIDPRPFLSLYMLD